MRAVVSPMMKAGEGGEEGDDERDGVDDGG